MAVEGRLRFSACVLAVGLVLGIAACGSSNDSSGLATPETSDTMNASHGAVEVPGTSDEETEVAPGQDQSPCNLVSVETAEDFLGVETATFSKRIDHGTPYCDIVGNPESNRTLQITVGDASGLTGSELSSSATMLDHYAATDFGEGGYVAFIPPPDPGGSAPLAEVISAFIDGGKAVLIHADYLPADISGPLADGWDATELALTEMTEEVSSNLEGK